MNDMSTPEMLHRCPVNSYTEWDPLEEVIVGRLDGAVMPTHMSPSRTTCPDGRQAYRLVGGRRYPRILTSAAQGGP